MSRILIIDDDTDWCESTLKRPLEPLGYEITTEKDRSIALKLIQDKNFDLAILNVRLDEPVRDEKITSQWTELLDIITISGAKAIIVTSKAFPPSIQLHKLLRMAFKDYGVADFLIKEDFNVREYRKIVKEVIEEDSNNILFVRSLATSDRQRLINYLADLPTWKTGGHQDRFGVLLATGLAETYVRTCRLDGAADASAGLAVNYLEGIGDLADSLHSALGLLVKALYTQRPDREGQLFLAGVMIRYKLTRDPELIIELEGFLGSNN